MQVEERRPSIGRQSQLKDHGAQAHVLYMKRFSRDMTIHIPPSHKASPPKFLDGHRYEYAGMAYLVYQSLAHAPENARRRMLVCTPHTRHNIDDADFIRS